MKEIELEEKLLIFADAHIPRCPGPALIYLRHVLELYNQVLILGDFFDRYQIFLHNYFSEPESVMKEIWKYLRLDKKKVYYILGNHEIEIKKMGINIEKILGIKLLPHLVVKTEQGAFIFVHDLNDEIRKKLLHYPGLRYIIAGHQHKASTQGRIKRLPAYINEVELFTLSPKGEFFHHTEALELQSD